MSTVTVTLIRLQSSGKSAVVNVVAVAYQLAWFKYCVMF